jgi:hypothetical protein
MLIGGSDGKRKKPRKESKRRSPSKKRRSASTIDPVAKEVLKEIAIEIGLCKSKDACDLLRPHIEYDLEVLKEKELRQQANRIFAGIRDKNKERSCLNYKDKDGESTFVNVDTTEDKDALAGVRLQIDKKYTGIKKTRNKVNRRQKHLNQIVFDFGEKFQNDDNDPSNDPRKK